MERIRIRSGKAAPLGLGGYDSQDFSPGPMISSFNNLIPAFGRSFLPLFIAKQGFEGMKLMESRAEATAPKWFLYRSNSQVSITKKHNNYKKFVYSGYLAPGLLSALSASPRKSVNDQLNAVPLEFERPQTTRESTPHSFFTIMVPGERLRFEY